MIDLLTGLVYLVVFICTAFYGYYRFQFAYWNKRGVPTIEPKIPFGNMQGFKRTMHSSQLMKTYYDQFKRFKFPFGGLFLFSRPFVLVVDLDLVRNVLIKDFNTFPDRGLFYNEKDDPLSAHLVSVDGQRWKNLRSKLTPTFTSGKIKFMFPTIVTVGDQFQLTLKEILKSTKEVEIRDVLARFTTDVIGTCAFGIECNSLKDPNAEFRRMGKKVFQQPRNSAAKQIFMITFKRLALALKFRTTHEDVSAFFMKIVRETVEYREKNAIKRNDFMDLLMQLRKTGKLEGEEGSAGGALSMEEIAAQAFVFFLAGFETSSTTMTYSLYELALNPEIQSRARNEINETLKKHGGHLTYEAMLDMPYLDQIINESLRKYPPAANLIRRSCKDYVVPGTDKTIAKGTTIWIPVYAIHHDPDIYPEPEKFDPERFSHDNVIYRHPQAHLPFGDGPRNCIGLRFGMMQTRIGLITLLKHFRFKLSKRTQVPLKFSFTSVILTPSEGVYMEIEAV